MNEQFFKQLIAELITGQEQAFAILTTAMCQQLNPGQLQRDLEGTIAAAKLMPTTPSLTLRFAQAAMAAAEAERMHQARPPSEGPYPTRG